MSPGPKPTSVSRGILTNPLNPAVWLQSTWAENWASCCALLGGGPGSPSNTTWSGPRPISIPSGILIHPTVWPQYTNVTDRQNRQRSVLQSVAQKRNITAGDVLSSLRRLLTTQTYNDRPTNVWTILDTVHNDAAWIDNEVSQTQALHH